MVTIEYLRSFRIGGYALFDLGVSLLGIWLLSPLLSKLFRLFGIEIPKKNWLLLTLPMSVIIHLLVGNWTQMTRDAFDPQGHFGIKLVLIVLLWLGCKGISWVK